MLSAADPLPFRPRRVVVTGTSGVGKTTAAARIAAALGVPHTEMDALYHGPGWTPRPEFAEDVARFTAAPGWTTEYMYRAAKPLLNERMDVLVWLDLPYWRVNFPRIVRRTVRRSLRRERLWNGNREAPLRTVLTDPDHVIRWSVRTRANAAEEVPRVAAANPRLVVVRLRSTREVDAWIRRLAETPSRKETP